MDFTKQLEKVLNEDFNNSTTENGALGYRTTGTALLDFNFKVSSYRNKPEAEIINDFMKVFYEDKLTAMKFLFFIRDREEGLGERRIFRVLIKQLAKVETVIIKAVIPIIAEYRKIWWFIWTIWNPIRRGYVELYSSTMEQRYEGYARRQEYIFTFKMVA